MESPREVKAILQAMCHNLTRVTNIAQQLVMTVECGSFARFEINRKDVEKKPRRPFQARMETETKQRYQQAWHRIICIMYRTYQAPMARPYQLTGRQRQIINWWVALAQRPLTDEESSSHPFLHRSNSEMNDGES